MRINEGQIRALILSLVAPLRRTMHPAELGRSLTIADAMSLRAPLQWLYAKLYQPPAPIPVPAHSTRDGIIDVTTNIQGAIGREEIYVTPITRLLIPEDTLLRHLNEYTKKTAKGHSRGVPLSVFVGLSVRLSTLTFQEKYGISADTWYALFIGGAGLCFFWFLISLVFAIRYWWIQPSPKDVLDEIKKIQ